MLSISELKKHLRLEPLVFEGGFYRETYRSTYGTAIYYLLTPNTFSRMHRLKSDEIYHFYLGDPVELLILSPEKRTCIRLGHDLAQGMEVQTVVRSQAWQGARLAPGGKFALMGTTMAPGFKLEDFEAGDRAQLVEKYREYETLIRNLTP